jgi:DNA-binding LytR/AlgR family response regulator
MGEPSRVRLTHFEGKEDHLEPEVTATPRALQANPGFAAWRVNVHSPSLAGSGASAERTSALLDTRPRSDAVAPKAVKIAIKSKGKILLISPADILAVEAEGNYVLLLRHSDSHLLRESISTMAEKLKPYHFVRIHRSVLVNASTVEEIYPGPTGEYMLRIAGGKQYIVSRTYKCNLKLLAQSWIGTDSFIDD